MSRTAITVVCIVLGAVAWGFQVLAEFLRPMDAGPVSIFHELGGALAIFGIAAAIPLVVWAIGRFQASRALVPLIIWGGLIVVIGGLATVGTAARSGTFKVSALLPKGTTQTPQFRENFIRSARKSCTASAGKQQNVSAVFSTAEIDSYCGCFAAGSADMISDEDMAYIVDHAGATPPGFAGKMKPVVIECLRKARRGNG